MDSSNVRALWEARTKPELSNLTLKPILPNQRKHSDVDQGKERQRCRIGSSRKRTLSNPNSLEKLSTDIQELDDILLRQGHFLNMF